MMRLHQMREKGFTLRKGKRLGENERLVTGVKPACKPKKTDLSDTEWEQLPATMEMRLIAFWYEDRDGAMKKMVLATTLLDHDTYGLDRVAVAKSKKSFARRLDEMLALVRTKCIEVRTGRWEPRMKKTGSAWRNSLR